MTTLASGPVVSVDLSRRVVYVQVPPARMLAIPVERRVADELERAMRADADGKR